MQTDKNRFETERLILKPTSIEDAPFILELLNSPKWIKFIGDRNVKTIEAAEEYVTQKMTPQHKRLGFGNYTVIRKSDNTKMGSCGLYDREGLDGIDIGFAFLPQFEKKGYGSESAFKVKDLAINKFGITKLNAITTKENVSSQKLLEKLEFKFEKFITLPNETEEIMFYSFKS